MLLRNTTDTAQRQQGYNVDASGGDIQLSELEWNERALLTNQFLGAHIFPTAWDLTLKWQYTLSEATSDLPDTRTYRYDPYTLFWEDDLIFRSGTATSAAGNNLNDKQTTGITLVQPRVLRYDRSIG
jgi:hypothetical protein